MLFQMAKISLLALLTTISVNEAKAQFNPFNPAEVRIDSVTFAGSGCPSGSVRALLAPDASAITILYDSFQAQVDRSNPNDRKSCDVVIKLKKPRLYSFAIVSADFRGFVYLDRGSRASQTVRLETGHGDLARLNLNLGVQSWQGPVNENYVLRAVKPVEGLKYLSCLQPKREGRLRVKSTVAVETGRNGTEGTITVDSFDGSIVQTYNLRWMDCLKLGIGAIDGLLRP